VTASLKKPKLLIVTTTFPRWEDDPGPAPFVFHHAKALLEHFGVTVLAPHFKGAAAQEDMDGVKVKRFRYALPDGLELLTDGAGIRSNMSKGVLHKLIALPLLAGEALALVRETAGGHDFINSHWLVPSGLLASLVAPASKRHVITAHAADYDLLLKLPGGKALIKRMYKKAHALVCVSERLGGGIAKIAGESEKIVIQSMGVNTEVFKFDGEARAEWRRKLGADDRPLVLFAGKLTAKKGVDVLIKAAQKIKEQGTEFMVAIVGDGIEGPRLEAMARDTGLESAVRFMGPVPNRELARLYSAADVVAVPSVRDPKGETEGMPVVILEALAAGRPVAASRLCSAPRDLVGSGVVEVKEGDPEALALAIKDALLGSIGVDREAISAYDVKAVAKRYADLFMEEVE
jgi:glycosyltransferase involved in cell wall biosynthesis